MWEVLPAVERREAPTRRKSQPVILRNSTVQEILHADLKSVPWNAPTIYTKCVHFRVTGKAFVFSPHSWDSSTISVLPVVSGLFSRKLF